MRTDVVGVGVVSGEWLHLVRLLGLMLTLPRAWMQPTQLASTLQELDGPLCQPPL